MVMRGLSLPKNAVKVLIIYGERKQPILTITKTIVVAKFIDFSGAAQANQLYIYGIAKPEPNTEKQSEIGIDLTLQKSTLLVKKGE